MYEILTGQPPYNGETILALMTKKITEQPASIEVSEKINRKQIIQFERIIVKAMAKAPEDRYQNANELHTDLLLSSDLGRSKVKRSRISIVFDKLFGSSDN